MSNVNNELLSWAVENIKEWEEGWPYLLSDISEYSASVFYVKTLDDWASEGDFWSDNPGAAYYSIDTDFSTAAPQVITREEWQAARIAKDAPTTPSEAQQGHIHAELMAEYALVAKTNPEPWREFQVLNSEETGWEDLVVNPGWPSSAQYRRKPTPPKTMNIGGIVVEAWPLDHMPSVGFEYYSVVVGYYNDLFDVGYFTNRVSSYDAALLYAGKVFSTKEQAQAVADALNLVYNRALGRGEG